MQLPECQNRLPYPEWYMIKFAQKLQCRGKAGTCIEVNQKGKAQFPKVVQGGETRNQEGRLARSRRESRKRDRAANDVVDVSSQQGTYTLSTNAD